MITTTVENDKTGITESSKRLTCVCGKCRRCRVRAAVARCRDKKRLLISDLPSEEVRGVRFQEPKYREYRAPRRADFWKVDLRETVALLRKAQKECASVMRSLLKGQRDELKAAGKFYRVHNKDFKNRWSKHLKVEIRALYHPGRII